MAAMPKSQIPKFKTENNGKSNTDDPQSRWPDDPARPDPTVADLVGKLDELVAGLRQLPAGFPSELSTGTSIEARVAHLEASSAHMQRDIAQMRTDVRDIRERVHRLQERAAHLPSGGLLAGCMLAVLASVAAAAAFQQHIQAFVAAAFG